MGTQRLKHGTQRFSRTWYPEFWKNPANLSSEFCSPDSSQPSFPSTRPEVYDVYESLENAQLGVKPGECFHGLSQWDRFFPPLSGAVWKGRLENVKQRIVSWLRSAVVDLKSSNDPPEVWRGRRIDSWERYLIYKAYLQTGPLQLFFLPFFPCGNIEKYMGFSNKKGMPRFGGWGGEGWWFSVGVILGLPWSTLRSVYFRFLLDM